MTIEEYDTSQLNEFMRSSLASLFIISGIHFYYGLVHLLFSQVILLPLRLYQNKLVKIHLLNEKGDHLKRPFSPPPNPLLDLMSQVDTQKSKKKETKKKR